MQIFKLNVEKLLIKIDYCHSYASYLIVLWQMQAIIFYVRCLNMKKLRIGLLGIGRGSDICRFCSDADNAEIVAICDKWEEGLKNLSKKLNDDKISYYTDYDKFILHDMDAVYLANYATEHAPFAIKAMEAGKDVISEVLPVQTMSEAVRLIECCERTGKKYCYAENNCFMGVSLEAKKIYKSGKLGEFEYGEGEYLHNCESVWTDITYGEREHWRNRMTAFFYCTHSVGPLLHVTGLKPKKVTGFECPFNARMARMGAMGGHTAVEMITLENDAVVKSVHGVGCSKCSTWYTFYGSKGRIESAREAADQSGVSRVYVDLDEKEGIESNNVQTYIPEAAQAEVCKNYGHGGSDYYCFYNAADYILGNKNADIIDLYEALDMWMCGFFGYISVLSGGIPMEIPDMHDPKVREQFRNDNRCTDPKVAGEHLLPSNSKGNPEIPEKVYEIRKEERKRNLENKAKSEDNK